MNIIPDDHVIYSCDDHLDIFNVPGDLWTARIDKKYHDIIPHVEEIKGREWVVCSGKRIAPYGAPPKGMSALDRVENLENAGLRPSNPQQRMEDMAHDNIYASIVYGPGSLFSFAIDAPEIKTLVTQAWNDWAAEEFNSYKPGRLSALAMLPIESADIAVAELQRAITKGHRGAIINCFEIDMFDQQWEKLWAAAAESGVPLSFHIGGGHKFNLQVGWQRAAFAAMAPMCMKEPLSVMIYSGALERNPGLKLVLAECGIGWLPYYIARMDGAFEKHCISNPKGQISTKPSELFYRQVYATFEEETYGPELIPLLGHDNLMWACDYPHPDSTWPNSQEAIEETLGTLGEEAIRKMTGETCKKLYKLDD